MLYQICFPVAAYALTGGPSQPEVESFEPVGTSEMVDVFSGDFNYNIPLLDVDGYPINIAYHSGVTMDQEASWVGLGWNLNPGVMNRNMRGIPDDFDGDLVGKLQYVKPNRTFGLNVGYGMEIFGKNTDKGVGKFLKKIGAETSLQLGLGVNYNNYTGLGIESSISPSISGADKAKPNFLRKLGLNASLDIASSSKDGLSIKPKVGMATTLLSKANRDNSSFALTNSTSVGMAINSRSGVKSLTISSSTNATASKTYKKTNASGQTTKATNVGGGYSMNSGGAITFGTQTYVPSISQEMTTGSFSFNTKLGLQLPFLNPNMSYSGYYSSQHISDSWNYSWYSYGNMYGEHADANEYAIRDFNREKEGSFSEKNPVLPIPVYTYDLYQASGQGISGMFKPYRGDIPTVHDTKRENISKGANIGFEFAKLNLFKAGLNITYNYSSNTVGKWADGNRLANRIKSKSKQVNDSYEAAYFKSVGEKAEVPYTANLEYKELENGALRPKLEQTGNALISGRESVTSENKLIDVDGGEVDITSVSAIKTQRDKRNTFMSYRTGAEKKFCLDEKIYCITNPASPEPLMSCSTCTASITRGGDAKDKHISEVSLTKNDGARYVYGIPAYNNKQYEISFTNAQEPGSGSYPTKYCDKGQVAYTGIDHILAPSKSEVTERDHKGNDHAYSVDYIPAYAHSYLLTDVLSADYVDISNDGPDRYDYGSYTHLTYYRVHDDYKWRVPYSGEGGRANYNEGLKSDKTDDNASVLYGEKEIWHVAKIESKNHYALFYISARKDGYGVAGEHGFLDESAVSYKLDRIELFAYNEEGVTPTPIKTVHFEYDYSLCPNAENNIGTELTVNEVDLNAKKGKLTLKKIYFTYGSSKKGRFNAYTFNYSEHNPDYNMKGYDRWGNYKPNPLVEELGLNCNAASHTLPLSNAEFPYVDQDKFPSGHLHEGKYKADVHAAAWHLNQIMLPSGGIINVEYEADDYAHIQDKEATQMAKLIGFCDYTSALADPEAPLLGSGGITYSGAMYNQTDPKECVLFKLPEELLAETDMEGLKQRLKNGLGQYLYYNWLINLTDGNNDDKHYEYVRGYTEIMDAGIINKGHGNLVGWIKVGLKAGDSQHPVSRSAWQYARMYLPYLVYPGSNLRQKIDAGEIGYALLKGIAGFIPDLLEMIEGINNKLRRNNFGKDVLTEKSWIRIPSLTGFKKGGGSRVKKLWLNDQWNEQSGSGASMSYGQEYTYTTQVSINGQTKIISSGVASYEPAAGNDENPWKQPVAYDKENIGVPDDEFYSEEPFGESYFPTPLVGYSRVEVKNLVPADAVVNAHGTGKVVHQYYTAKDFPVITSKTGVGARLYETSALFSILGIKAEQDMTMAQGFQVELNDMHGKPKATLNYDQNNIASYSDADAFSGIKYNYKVQDETADRKILKNEFDVVDKANNIHTNAIVGVESEMVMDSRTQQSKTISGGMQLNLEYSTLGIFPFVTFFAWPDFSSEYSTFKSSVLVRVVNRFGLLSSTEAFEEGSNVKTENVLLDAETGETLLTKTYNEYRDPVYNFTMPAHWAYDGMGQAYKNTGLTATIKKTGQLEFMIDHTSPVANSTFFTDGDVIAFPQVSAGPLANEKFYVRHNETNDKWFILDKNGTVVDLKSSILRVLILQSGRKNMQGLPVMQVSSLSEPVSSSHLDFSSKNVLNASAVSYNKRWRTESEEQTALVNPYKRAKEIVGIVNYLLSSGQLNNSTTHTVNHVIDTTYPGKEAVTLSSLLPLYGTMYFKTVEKVVTGPSLSSGGSFPLTILGENSVLGIPSSQDQINLLINDDETNTLLHNNDTDLGNDIIPTHIELVTVPKNAVTNYGLGMLFKVIITYQDEDNVTQHKYSEMRIEQMYGTYTCTDLGGYTTNPFIYGLETAWRKQKDWVFYGKRDAAANINLRKDGTINSFVPYWAPGSGVWTASSDARWTCTNEVTKYSVNGDELENKDALGRYAAAIYSRKMLHMPLAVAGNARYTQIGNENGEEYGSVTTCNQKALDFEHGGKRSAEQAHTGKYSIKLQESGDNDVTAVHPVLAEDASPDLGLAGNIQTANDYNGFFNPTPGEYVFGAWVKVTGHEGDASYYDGSGAAHAEVVVHTASTSVSVPMYPKGQIIEGWQRIEGKFTVAPLCIKVEFFLKGDATDGSSTYFDDMRVHPFDGKLKTYVYDPLKQLLWAELDENNYATFYEYNAEGKLVRVKKETEKGIVTLKEVRSNQRKVITP